MWREDRLCGVLLRVAEGLPCHCLSCEVELSDGHRERGKPGMQGANTADQFHLAALGTARAEDPNHREATLFLGNRTYGH